jgi:hypothetical protein
MNDLMAAGVIKAARTDDSYTGRFIGYRFDNREFPVTPTPADNGPGTVV